MFEEALVEAGCTVDTRKLIDFLLSDDIEKPEVLDNDDLEDDHYEEQASSSEYIDTSSDEDFEYKRRNKKHKQARSRKIPRKWTTEEDKAITRLVKLYPGNYKKIASKLGNRKSIFSSALESRIKTNYKKTKIFYRRRIRAN